MTLAERHSRFTMLIKVPNRDTAVVVAALSRQKELGSRYDVRAFHDEILNGGALPLDVLDERVANWIEAQKKVAARGSNP